MCLGYGRPRRPVDNCSRAARMVRIAELGSYYPNYYPNWADTNWDSVTLGEIKTWCPRKDSNLRHAV